jgi:hypothetical protein
MRLSIQHAGLVIAAIAALSLPTSSTPQGWYSWGVCSPLHTDTQAPPASACDSPCPTSTCGPACVDLIYVPASCSGDKPACGWELTPNHRTAVCRECACDNDPEDPRCVSTGYIYRTGSATMADCFN